MSHLLFYYERPEPATWVFLSSFLLLGIYFVFHRFFSVRNLDILLLLLLAPGLMMVYEGRRMQLAGWEAVQAESLASADRGTAEEIGIRHERYIGTEWGASGNSRQSLDSVGRDPSGPLRQWKGGESVAETAPLLPALGPSRLSRMKLASQVPEGAAGEPAGPGGYPDPAIEPDGWSPDDLEFWGFAALLMACGLLLVRMLIDPALVRRPLLVPNLSIGGLSFIGISLFLFLMANVITSTPRDHHVRSPRLGPGYALLNMLPALPTTPDEQEESGLPVTEDSAPWLPNLARILAIVSNLAIVLGIVGVGYWHFDNIKTGIGCAVMYLLLPYTAQMTGNLEHVAPAALLILALLAYRQPLISGILLGMGAGLVYYPLFLLPLWISFYWHRGLSRLLMGVIGSLGVLSGLLLLEGLEAFDDHLRWMFGLWLPRMEGLEGVWGPGGIQPDFRLPVLVGFILLSVSFVFWPSRKNLGSLMCGTAAVMLAAQFWHGNGGGLFMAWFLPFVLLTVFRPNLDDRIASQVVRASMVRTSST